MTQDINIPYKYICVEGNIGSGKTSFVQMIQKEYACEVILEEFQDNPFPVSYTHLTLPTKRIV